MALNLSIPRPQLMVRMMSDETGRVIPLLTDISGLPLPMQRRVVLDYAHDGRAELTVTFAIDGVAIQLLPDGQEHER